MEKQKVTIQVKKRPIVTVKAKPIIQPKIIEIEPKAEDPTPNPSPSPSPTTDLDPNQSPPTSPEPVVIDPGQSVAFADIEKGGIMEKTWINYVNFIVKFYKILDLDDETMFYWEFLSKPQTIDVIVKEILNRYTIRDGKALAGKLSPFTSILHRLEPVQEDALHSWNETITMCRKNFDDVLEKHGMTAAAPAAKKDISTWPEEREKLHTVSQRKDLDSRVRVLSTIYKYGYVFRMPTIFRTYFDPSKATGREKYNLLDLGKRIWTVKEGNQQMSFLVNKEMCEELRALMVGGIFERGWVLPRRNGMPYASEASLSSFSSWSKAGLHSYRVYRKLYTDWLKAQVEEEEYQLMVNIIDHNMIFETLDYIPPIPINITDSEQEEDLVLP